VHEVKKPEFSLRLSEAEIQSRKRWLELSQSDEDFISQEINDLLCPSVDDLMDKMYEHFLSFEETKSFFLDPVVLHRAKIAQGDYFRRLTQGNYDSKYVQERLHIGSTHQRIDLDPKWYFGTYNNALSHLLPMLIESFKGDTDRQSKAVVALLKVIFFDMGLAIESYIGAKEYYIRKHRDTISELETERRVTKSILESAPIGIVSLDTDFVCVECNGEFVQFLTHHDRETVIGQSIFAVAPNVTRTVFEEVLRSGQPSRRNNEVLNLTKSPVVDPQYWDWAAWPVKDAAGIITGLVAMFSNTTDSVMLQQQREDFVATLTHDLKTPVSATNRAVKFLIEGDFGPVSESQREILSTIHQSNTALYSLVQTLLDVYRFDSGVKELHMKKCNIAAVVTQMMTEIMPLAQEKGVELRAVMPGDPKDLVCDEEEIRRVIQNLIDNSLKFTPTGGTITIALDQPAEKTLISVADTGKGIPQENKSKLFQRFWQSGSTGRYYASTGLGLYLCRRIVEAHQGRIWCESSPDKGATFTFEI